MVIKSCTPSGSRNLFAVSDLSWGLLPYLVPWLLIMASQRVWSFWALSSQLQLVTAWAAASNGETWHLPLPVAQAQSEIRAASGMNKLSVILMCVFSYILREGWNPVKISFLCFSQYLGSLIWHDYNLAGRRRGRAFMLVGICSHKFTGFFPS